MSVRRVNVVDYAEWQRMREALWPGCDPGELPAMAANPRAAVFVSERNSAGLNGFIEAGLRDVGEGCETSPVGYIEGWYVDPDMRGQGVGRKLVEAAEAWARSMGCTEMASDAVLTNTDSQAAHRRLGYEETERIVCFRKVL